MYYKVEISAESREEADAILNSLLEKRLVTGGPIFSAPARFLWKGEVVDMDYITITSFTLDKHKDDIIADVKQHSGEEVPMVVFLPMEGNSELLDWITATLQ